MSEVVAKTLELPAGGGAYALSDLTIGVFLNDQPSHRFSFDKDRSSLVPLKRHQGWILPAKGEGICQYGDDLELLSVSLDRNLLDEVKLNPSREFAPIIGDLNPLLLNLCLAAVNFRSGGTLYRETMQRALAVELKALIQPDDFPELDMSDQRLRRVIEYVHDNLSTDLSLTAMAEVAAMSPTNLSRAFKKEMGTSPLQYVIAERQEKAAVMLRTTDKAVSEVAWQVGYNDLSRFGQHFKRRFKVTPAQYRIG